MTQTYEDVTFDLASCTGEFRDVTVAGTTFENLPMDLLVAFNKAGEDEDVSTVRVDREGTNMTIRISGEMTEAQEQVLSSNGITMWKATPVQP